MQSVALDVGCGDNKLSPAFIGVDRRATGQTDVVTDAENLSCFSDSSMHAIYSSRALQHVPNDVLALKEINRVLAPDGLGVIEVSTFWNASVSIILNRLGIKKHPYTTYHVYTKRQLKQRIHDSGLRLVSLGSAPTMTPLFRNHLAIVAKGSQ